MSLFDTVKADRPYELTVSPQNNFTRVPNDHFFEKKSSYSNPEKAHQSAHGMQNLFLKCILVNQVEVDTYCGLCS